MDSLQYNLRIFEIPETLDWRSLLRRSGTDQINYLDASEADDPETWNESDVYSALGVLGQANFKNLGDCLNILTPELFNVIFNLNRYYGNLEKQNQILLCQFISTLCSKVQIILEAVPPKPYMNDIEASENVIYTSFVDRMASLATGEGDQMGGGLSDGMDEYSNSLTVSPKSLGIVLRSLISVSVFLVGMCYNFVTTFERGEGKMGSDLIKDKAKRGRKSKKDDATAKVNTVAIETLIDSMVICCKYNLKTPYLSEYGGPNRASMTMLRMLFQTLLNTLSLDESIHPVSNTILQSIAKTINTIFTTMESARMGRTFSTDLSGKDLQPGGGDNPDGMSEGPRPGKVDDLDLDKLMENDSDREWLSLLIDEMKKPHCQVIADVLEILKDGNIPNAIINELFSNIRENYSSQISNTNQLVSSMVQNEFTNMGLFFEKLAKKVPCVVLSNISQLKQLFDVPCYALRKSIMESIKSLIILSKYYDTSADDEAILDLEVDNIMETQNNFDDDFDMSKDDDKYKLKVSRLCCRNREMLLEIIISRQFDSYMYARACVLKVLYDLVEADALPVRKYSLVVSFATARLMDKGSQVRQRALQLVSLVVDVVTNKKFLLALNTYKLQSELDIIENNVEKVNYLMKRNSGKKRDRDDDSRAGSDRLSIPNSPSNDVDQQNAEFVDVEEFDHLAVVAELKCDFGDSALNNLDELAGKLDLAKDLYSDALDISKRVDACLELCKRLLRSPTETDQKASIKFICTCHLLGLLKATQMLPLVWALSWSNNQSVVESVLVEFKNVYFQDQSINGLNHTCDLLIELINTGDLTCLSSAEKIFQINQNKQQLLNMDLRQLIPLLIQIATSFSTDPASSATFDESNNRQLLRCRTSLNLIKVILSSGQSSYGSGDNKNPVNAAQNEGEAPAVKVNVDAFRWDMSIFNRLLDKYHEQILLEVCQILIYVNDDSLKDFVHYILKMFLNYFGTNNFNWFQICQIVIDLTFVHLASPLNLWSSILKELLLQLTSEEDKAKGSQANSDKDDNKSDVRRLSHLVFMTGHVAIRSLIYVEKVQNDLKIARSQLNEDELENNMGLATKDEKDREFFDNIIENKLVNDNLLGGPLFQIVLQTLVNPQKFIHPTEDIEFNFFDHLYGPNTESAPNTARSQTGKGSKSHDAGLEEAMKKAHSCLECNILLICSVISLCKFASISKKFCNIKFKDKKIIQIIILLLSSTSDNSNLVYSPNTEETPATNGVANAVKKNELESKDILIILKCNLLICYGDLLVRHPNVLEPMNDYVFKLLSYPVNEVRETAILVFSHLVMNDMIKPKGKLLDNIMFLTQDSNEKIANYARVFLNEIHRKNPNTIYNCFPEMLTTLSQPSTLYHSITHKEDGTEEVVEGENTELQGIKTNLKILNELFNFVKNDKQEHLVEKICIRLNKTKSIFATTIYLNALLLINYDEKTILNLSKSLNMLRQLLSESQPLLAALSIIHKRIKSSKVQKVQGQVDIKEVAEEMINKVKNILGQGKATMLLRATQFSEQIIELLNNGNYSNANLKALIEKSKQKPASQQVKKEDEDGESSSKPADGEAENEEDLAKNELSQSSQDQTYSGANDLAGTNEDLSANADDEVKDSSATKEKDELDDAAETSVGGKRKPQKRAATKKKTKVIDESDEEDGADNMDDSEEERTPKKKKVAKGKQKKKYDEDSSDGGDDDDFQDNNSDSDDERDYKASKAKANRGRKKRGTK